ncbi:hypothetical protein BDY24DRAFT_2997 [Mrakia frigida]|uniref:uncharacterized protein n=1 Tax=Mrakia frigida TaxID=29902 RepID=UPI003FCC225D
MTVVGSEDEEDDEENVPPPLLKSSSSKTPVAKVEEDEDDAGNVSEYSSMIDLTPKKNKTEKVEKKEKPAKPPKASTSSKASTSTPADETGVANLKKIVVACGMRKQWKKEFAGFEKDYRRQAKHIKTILLAFGIKGSPTLAKAKRRKEEVEEAQELADIQQGDAKHGLAASPPRRGSGAAASNGGRRSLVGRGGAKIAGSESEEEVKTPVKKKKRVSLSFRFVLFSFLFILENRTLTSSLCWSSSCSPS